MTIGEEGQGVADGGKRWADRHGRQKERK